jgi:hypothetical protein
MVDVSGTLGIAMLLVDKLTCVGVVSNDGIGCQRWVIRP